MEIKAHSDTSYDAYKIFFKNTVKSIKFLYIMLDIIISLGFIVGLFSVFAEGIKNLPLVFVFAAFGIICVLTDIMIPKISYKRTKIQGDYGDDYVFTEQNIHITSVADGVISQSDMAYDVIIKAYETERYVFLYIARDRAYIVDKSTVVGGNFDRVRDILYKRLGKKKYIIDIKL